MDTTGTFFLPPPNSTIASDVDALFYFILYASIFFFIIVVFGSIWFAVKYRRRGKKEFTPDISHNTRLEIIWTVIPTILVFIVFLWGFNTYLKMNVVPKDAMNVKVTGQKWFWSFGYDNGITTTNELVVPVGKPVQLTMSSKDVIHSFFVPDFRMKMDVLPNRYTIAWFEATNPGTFDLFCTEYCGKGHSEMIGKVKVVSGREYDEWIASNANPGAGMAPEEFGAKLLRTKACITCHSNDGSKNTGPTFKGLFGRMERLQDGSNITADENYIRESILEPQAKVVMGFQPVMPTYQGLLKDEEIDAMIAYLKTLK
ncbi:MAG: cytochrome c oxidase subunit II [Calditrichaceae bacterium]